MHDVIRQQMERLVTPWGLQPADISYLARQMHSHTYSPGEVILPFRARADFLGLIVSGQAAAYAGQRGAGQQVALLFPGSTFGDDMLGDNRASDTTLKAVTRCEVRFLRRADLEALASQRRSQGYQTTLGRLAALGAILFLVCLVIILVLSLPLVRQTIALVPMGFGQLCAQGAKGREDPGIYEQCALQAWTLAGKLAPDDANPPLAMGNLYFERGEMELARQSLEAAKALAPEWAEIHNNLGLIYAGQGEHEKAIASLRLALDLEPGTSTVEHNLGLSLQAVGDYDEALTHYRQAVAFGEPQAGTLVNMAIGYYETGQSAKAAAAAQQALRYDEASAPAYTVLGAVELESQQLGLALAHLRRATALDGNYSQAHFYLGLVYQALGQPAEAVAALEKALATTRDKEMSAEIQRHLGKLRESG
jgi:Flp pilus assembly protein TadD